MQPWTEPEPEPEPVEDHSDCSSCCSSDFDSSDFEYVVTHFTMYNSLVLAILFSFVVFTYLNFFSFSTCLYYTNMIIDKFLNNSL